MGLFVFPDLYSLSNSKNNSNPVSSAIIFSYWDLHNMLISVDRKSLNAARINRSHDIKVLILMNSAISPRLFSSSSMASRAPVKLKCLPSLIQTARTMNLSVNSHSLLSPLPWHRKRMTGKPGTEKPVMLFVCNVRDSRRN